MQHGGQLDTSDIAQFIFSNDWDHNDTKGFLTSQAYLKQHLAVLKPTFVLDAVRKEGLQNISIGNYLLIPTTVQKRIPLIKNNDSLTRSCNQNSPEIQGSADRTQEAEYLPHTSSLNDGMIGCSPQASQILSTETTARESNSVTNKMGSRGPVSCDKVVSTHDTEMQASTSSTKLTSVPRTESSLRCNYRKENTKSTEHSANNKAYGHIVHVQDLPKVTDRLYTLHAKGDGVTIRQKISPL